MAPVVMPMVLARMRDSIYSEWEREAAVMALGVVAVSSGDLTTQYDGQAYKLLLEQVVRLRHAHRL